MWEFFVKNSRFGYLFIVALVGVGIYSVLAIPRESAPEVVIPIGVVQTVLPGAPATDVESLVTNEIERGLTSLNNVKKITSTSAEGVSVITVEFEASADLDESIKDLKDTVDSLSRDLPADAEDPFVSEVNFVDQPIMTISVSGDLTPLEFRQLANELEVELEAVPSVSKVEISGVEEREATVLIDQSALKQYGLSLNSVIASIANANRSLPLGQISNNGITYNLAYEGGIEEVSDINNVTVTTLGGQPVFIRDIAEIYDGLSPATTISRVSVEGEPSTPAITVNVYKQSGGDITKITRAVRAELDTLKGEGQILSGLSYTVVLDSGELILTDLINLGTSGLQTVILVVLLLALTIGWRESLIAGTAIPLSFLIGFIGLYLSGNTINFLSLFALILGIGILVDSAIVMVEGINARMKANPNIDKDDASIETIREFASPLISGTLTTVAMFAGLFIVTGVIGQFISSIPFTLIFILLASLFVSLAIVPLFAAQFLRRRNTTTLEAKQVYYAHKLESWYQARLESILGNKKKERRFLWTIRLALVVAILLPVFGLVKVVFFEQGDVDYVIVEIETPEGTEKEITDVAVRRVEEVLYRHENIESFAVTVGSGSQFGGPGQGGGSGEKFANILITLAEDRDQTSTEMVETLRADLAFIRDVKITVNQPSDGPPTGAAVTIKYLGDDLVSLNEVAADTAVLLKSIPHTINVSTSASGNSTEFVLELDKAKAGAFGLDSLAISSFIRSAVFGSEATALTSLSDDIPVLVKVNFAETDTPSDSNQVTIDNLLRLEIPTQSGNIPLSTFLAVSLRESSSAIVHEDGKRVVTVTAGVTSLGNAREIQAEALTRVNDEIKLPAGVVLSTGGGEAEESNQAFIEMFLALIVGVGLMIGVLVFQFGSYLHTRYVLSILPYSLIGIFFGLAVTMNPLSFPSIMGFIALSGIVVNNSILLIDMMNQMRRKEPNKDIRQVVIEASVSRLRPILLTTLTTVIGMIPLTYAGDIWTPLAYAVMFGLTFSVIITLVLIPIIYNRKPGTINHR